MKRLEAEDVRMLHVAALPGAGVVVSLNGLRFYLDRSQAHDMALLLGAALNLEP